MPLDPNTRTFMEDRLGHRFSHVRIHPDAPSTTTILDVPVQAYTKGSNIYFGQGEYQPQRATGRRLIAHELVHVVQQQMAGPLIQGQGTRTLSQTLLEDEAEQISQEVVPNVGEEREEATEQLVVEGSETVDEMAPLFPLKDRPDRVPHQRRVSRWNK